MDIKPKKKEPSNIEDTYETLSKLDLGIKVEDIPETSDVKESLSQMLEVLDNKIYHLLRSNKELMKEKQ